MGFLVFASILFIYLSFLITGLTRWPDLEGEAALRSLESADRVSPALLQIILLAYSRLGGLEGQALQREIFLLLLFASGAGKKQQQKKYSRGPAAPRSPRWRVSQQYHRYGSNHYCASITRCSSNAARAGL